MTSHSEPEFWTRNESFDPDPIKHWIIKQRHEQFIKTLKTFYQNKIENKKCLLPHQETALNWLLRHPNIVI